MPSEPRDAIDRQIEELWERGQVLEDRCWARSSLCVYRELRNLAKRERRLIPYIRATIAVSHEALDTFETELGMELAAEMIALLESEDHARQFQPDFPEEEYRGLVFWLSTCAYHHLGTHAAIRDGYGSPRVRDVVREGNEVCRRTGKLGCLECFRDFTVWVYLTLGDEQTALHVARSIENKLPLLDQGDHRFEGARMNAYIQLLSGRLTEAVDQSRRALELAKVYHTPQAAKLDAFALLGTALHAAGRGDELEVLCAEVGEPLDWSLLPPEEENPELVWRKALFDAVVAVDTGRTAEAADILEHWDRRLSRWEAIPQWLETRTRRIAALRLWGKSEAADALEEDLRRRVVVGEAALFFSRLEAMTSGRVAASAIAYLRPPRTDRVPLPPLAKGDAPPPGKETSALAAERANIPAVDWDQTPMGPRFNAWFARLPNGTDASPEDMEVIFNEMLAVPPESVELPEDGARLIFVAAQMASVLKREKDVWHWAKRLLARFPEHPDVLNLSAMAGLGAWVRQAQIISELQEAQESDETSPGEGGGQQDTGATPSSVREGIMDPELPDQQTLEHMMRKSLDLKSDHPRHYYRAGVLFHVLDLQGDAEWCFARSFALDRSQAASALALAEVYRNSNRVEDALFVLDLCLREGQSRDSDVAWEAGLTAVRLERYAEAITYLALAEEWGADQPWLPYYYAWALLECKRLEEAAPRIRAAAERHGEEHLAVRALRAWWHAAHGERETFRDILQTILDRPLAAVEDLTPEGIETILQRLWRVCKTTLPDDDPLSSQLVERLFQAGMVPQEYFSEERANRPITEDLIYFECDVEQPLDEDWPRHPACLAGQADWRRYYAAWGALARNEEEAEHYVIQAQQRCYPLPPSLVTCEEVEIGFRDRPGVVWQGVREVPGELDRAIEAEVGDLFKQSHDEGDDDDEDWTADGDFPFDADEDDDEIDEDDKPLF